MEQTPSEENPPQEQQPEPAPEEEQPQEEQPQEEQPQERPPTAEELEQEVPANCPHCGADHDPEEGRFCAVCGLSVVRFAGRDEPQQDDDGAAKVRCRFCGVDSLPPRCTQCGNKLSPAE